jgi:FkbM family methyltransferase
VLYDGMWRESVIAGKAIDIKLAGKAILLNRHRAEGPIPPVRARWMDTSINPKRIAFQSLKKLGIDVRRSRKHPTLIDFIENRGVKVVYDVGANVGQFGIGLRQRGYNGKIFSFEPVKSAFDALKSAAATDGNWNVLQCAVGSEAGEVWVNVSANTQFSSIKSLSEKAASIDPNSGIVGREKVVCANLDELAASQGPTLIKIDTQGFEREVLKGATRALSQAVGVFMELPIIDVYDDSWSFLEAIRTMDELGFVPCQIDPVNHHQADRMAAIEFDCLFRREADGID